MPQVQVSDVSACHAYESVIRTLYGRSIVRAELCCHLLSGPARRVISSWRNAVMAAAWPWLSCLGCFAHVQEPSVAAHHDTHLGLTGLGECL